MFRIFKRPKRSSHDKPVKIPVLAVLRDKRFSPNSVENDKAILLAVCAELKMQLTGVDDIRVGSEKSFIEHPSGADIILSMARSEEALSLLSGLQKIGVGTTHERKWHSNGNREG